MRYATALMFALILSSCSPDAGIVVGATYVEDPSALASLAAEGLSDRLPRDGSVAVSVSPECFFSVGEDGSAESRLFCGPVSRLDGEGPWAVISLDSIAGSLVISGLSSIGSPAPSGRALLDGDLRAPSLETFIPPPPLAAGGVLGRASVPGAVLFTSRPGWDILAPGGPGREVSPAVQVLGTAYISSFGSGYAQISAPSAHTLVIIDMTLRDDIGSRDVSVVTSLGETTLSSVDRYLVVAVPDKDPQILLRLRSSDQVQHISLADGSRGGDFPSLWYGSPDPVVSGRTTVSGRVGLPPMLLPGTLSPVVVEIVASATVEVLPPTLFGPDGIPAPRGEAWIPLKVGRPDLLAGSPHVRPSLRFSGTFSYDDDASPLILSSSSPLELFALVPDDLPDLVFTISAFLLWETSTFVSTSSGVEFLAVTEFEASFR